MIELHNIVKTYQVDHQSLDVLKGIDLSIEGKTMAAIMGPSGSGKSTLMNIIGLLDTPTEGQYWLDGRNVGRLSRQQRALIRNQQIGFIFQSFYLLPHLTGLENVILPLQYQNAKSGLERRGKELMEQLGVSHLANKKPNAMSGGEQQRVATARALVSDPNIILADEPTGALDSQTGQKVMDLLRHCHQTLSKTVIIITHDAEVAEYCQRKIHIKDGNIQCPTIDASTRGDKL